MNDLVLFPLLAFFLGLAVWSLGNGVSRHGVQGALVLGWIGAALMVAGIFILPALIYAGAATMVGASIWNALAISPSSTKVQSHCENDSLGLISYAPFSSRYPPSLLRFDGNLCRSRLRKARALYTNRTPTRPYFRLFRNVAG
ncbi:MAG: MerC domain-containing protein [Rubrobacteraceae bacterium]